MNDDLSLDDAFAFCLLPYPTPALSFPQSDTWASPEEQSVVYDPLLPPPFAEKDGLVGRNVLFHQLKQRIFSTRRIALYGLPGVGKTALAIALAHDPEVRIHFCDGVLWAGLGLQVNLPAVLRRWGTRLGVKPIEADPSSTQRSWIQALREVLENRRMLLLIDGAWQEDVAMALDVGGVACVSVLTTRFTHIAENFAGEHTFLIPELGEAAGAQILTRFAPELMLHERETVRNLVRAVGGLPLALTLMGKYLGGLAFTKQPRRLRAALTYLQDTRQRLLLQVSQEPFEQSNSLPEKAEISIESVISLSYFYLSLSAQNALCSLSVFPAKPTMLSRNAVLAVTRARVETLQALCDAGLVEQARSGQYLIHPLIIDYARSRGIRPEAISRLIVYGVDFVEAHVADAVALEQESAIIITALQWAWEEKRYAELIRGSHCFVPWLLRWGWYEFAEQVLEHTTMALHGGNRRDEIILQEQLSTLAHAQGNYDRSRLHAREGLSLAYATGDEENAIMLLIRLGVVAQEQGDYTQAETLYQEGLIQARARGMTEQIALLLKNLGVLAKKRGSYADAKEYYRESLALASLLKRDDLISLLLMNLGTIATEQGAYLQALAFYQEGLALAQKAGNRDQICILLSNLGVVADAQGDYVQAELYLRQGLALARSIGHREHMSLLLLNLGVTIARQGDDLSAEELYQEGLTLARKIGHRERISLLLLNLGDVAMEQGRDTEALACYQEGLTLAQEIHHLQYMSDLQLHLGILVAKQGEVELAESYLRQGLTQAYQLRHPQLICKGLAAWGELSLQRCHFQAAEQAFLTMYDLIPVGYRVLEAHAQYGLARFEASQGQLIKAKALAEQSYATFEALGHRKKHVVHAFLTNLPIGPGI